METDRIEVEGMSCSHCVERVRAAMEAVRGVDVQSVDIGEVRFLRDPSIADHETVAEAIRSVGYPAK